MGELATFLHDQGHSVQVITGLPNYPSGKVASEYADQTSMVEDWNGVKVFRERSKYAGREDSVITKRLSGFELLLRGKASRPECGANRSYLHNFTATVCSAC